MPIEIPSDVCVLVANFGIGDHYLVAALAEAFGRHHGLRVWMAGRPDMGFVIRLFPAVERYLAWPAGEDPSAHGEWKVTGGALYYAHFPKLELMRAVGYDGFHFLDAYRCRLGLPCTAGLTQALRSTPAEIAAAKAALCALGLEPGRTVLLSIEARTTPTEGIDGRFWSTLAGELAALGLQPVVNAAPKTQVPDGMASVAMPIMGLRALAEAAGHVCTLRSGLSELFCDLPCARVVVYSDTPYWAGSLFEGTTLTRFGLDSAPHEAVIRPGEFPAKAREIALLLAGAGAAIPPHLEQTAPPPTHQIA